MTKRELTCFLSVYELRSIKEAAEKLYITSQGLSKTIKKLEEELDVNLFVRTTKGLEPTIYAKNLKRRAENIIREYENIRTDMLKEEEDETIVLTIPLTYGMINYLSIDFVIAFYSQYPNYRLNIVEYPDHTISQMVNESRVELALLSAPCDTMLFDARFCVTHNNKFLINKKHPLAKKTILNYEDLKNIPIAVNGRAYNSYENSVNLWIKNGIIPNVYLETSEEILIKDFVENNLGIGITLDFIAASIKSTDIIIRPVPSASCGRDVYLIKKRAWN